MMQSAKTRTSDAQSIGGRNNRTSIIGVMRVSACPCSKAAETKLPDEEKRANHHSAELRVDTVNC